MAEITLWDTDAGKVLSFAIVCGATVFDLSGATLVCLAINDGRQFTLSIVNESAGMVRHVVSQSDFTRARLYTAQLVVFASGDKIFNTSTFQIQVQRAIKRI